MATIFEKLPASGEKCLILEPREALVYPFYLGDYNSIRVAVGLSAVSINDDNGPHTAEAGATIFPSNISLTDSTTGKLLSNGVFLGVRTQSVNALQWAGIGGYNSFSQTAIFVSNNESEIQKTLNIGENLISLPNSGQSVGTTGFCSINYLGFSINKDSKSFRLTKSSGPSSPTSDTSINFLRSFISNADPSNNNNAVTGFYTDTFTQGGNLLPLPSVLTMSFPFINNRIRVHSILIEKYA